METLTKKQEQVLQFIAHFAKEQGFPPSVREIGTALGGIKSSTVAQHIKALIKKGKIERGSSRARDIRLSSAFTSYGIAGAGVRGHPVFGRVPAGKPNVVDEEVEDVIWLDERVSRSKDSYLIRVNGDSMINAGIMSGDLLVVRPQKSADPGTIVVARTPDGEVTVKRLTKKAEKFYLEPANPKYNPILEPFEVVGKVMASIRRF
jgi:repressor LexA